MNSGTRKSRKRVERGQGGMRERAGFGMCRFQGLMEMVFVIHTGMIEIGLFPRIDGLIR
jgi:hypothetical protein